MKNDVSILARTNWRNDSRLFGIRTPDRHHHLYLVGQTGTGKSTLLESLIQQDLMRGDGLALLDPHGDLAGRVALSARALRPTGVIVFDPADPACTYRFNPLAAVSGDRRTVAVAAILECFEKLWPSAWGPRLEHVLRNTLLALFELERATLADIPRMCRDHEFRRGVVATLKNEEVRGFWGNEFEVLTPRAQGELVGPILNKVGAFLADPMMRRAVAGSGEALDVREVMDQGKVLIVNMAKGRVGGTNAALLGALILSRIELAALERVDMLEGHRRDFWVYLDEFQNFMTLGLASMLSELRKYRVGLVLAHQYVGQLTDELRKAIVGNVGTLIVFRLGLDDARHIESLFAPIFSREDLVNLPNYEIYLRLLVDGRVTQPFSAKTIAVSGSTGLSTHLLRPRLSSSSPSDDPS